MTVWSATRHQPSKNAGSDPEAFRLRPVMAITAAGAGSYMPDPISRIRFSSFFSKELRHGPYFAKPTRIRSGRPGQGLAKRITFWSESKPVYRNHWVRFLAGRIGPVPASHFQTRFRPSTYIPDNIVQNQPGSDLVVADSVSFGQTDPVRKRANVQESSGQLLANASQPIRTGCESDPACLLGGFCFH